MKKGYRLFLDKSQFNQINPPVFSKRNDGRIIQRNSIRILSEQSRARTKNFNDEIYDSLTRYILADGTVDGDEILSSYFPTVKAHVFISHSHDDVDLALAFSQWLYDCFGIEAFVDHTIWGSGDKLIRTLDNEYSFDAEKKVYNYSTRNLTTSFVHLMLASAISKMIDTCDCLFFLNSPNSLSSDPKGNTTGSPWIFYELLMAKLLKKEEPSQRHFSQGGRVTEGRTSFIVRQTPPIDNLKHLTPSILNMWRQKVHDKNPKEALRILYDFY